METIWIKPVDHFRWKDNFTFYKETPLTEIGKIFLLAVDKEGNTVAGLRLKSWREKLPTNPVFHSYQQAKDFYRSKLIEEREKFWNS